MKTLITLLTIVASMLLLTQCNKDCIKSERCYMKPDPGPCKAYIPKYYYDIKEKKAKQFIWGGCDGVIPFDSMEECEKACGCE